MIKVLWIVNNPTKEIADNMGTSINDCNGWLTGILNELVQYTDIDLSIAFPFNKKENLEGKVRNIKYYSFYQDNFFVFRPANKVSQLTYKHMNVILDKVKPDILHIFGTEFIHSMIAAETFAKPSKTLIHIQGLTSICSYHYISGLPVSVLKKFAISNLLRGNILKQKRNFFLRGQYESKTIRLVDNVVGRTDWDEACTKMLNPSIKYYFCNESLRDEFYKYQWNAEKCEKFSIFMSQASYPIKGIHFMISALPEILKDFPDAHLYVAGNDLTNTRGIYNKARISSYGLYIKKLIKKYKLENHITFTGFLNEKQMCDRYLKSNIFISTSTIENSPNSVGEAMLLGVPTISSDVGGVKNLLNHNTEGFIYQHDAYYMIPYYVKKIFDNEELANQFSKNGKNHAMELYDRKKNVEKLLCIYKELAYNR